MDLQVRLTYHFIYISEFLKACPQWLIRKGWIWSKNNNAMKIIEKRVYLYKYYSKIKMWSLRFLKFYWKEKKKKLNYPTCNRDRRPISNKIRQKRQIGAENNLTQFLDHHDFVWKTNMYFLMIRAYSNSMVLVWRIYKILVAGEAIVNAKEVGI